MFQNGGIRDRQAESCLVQRTVKKAAMYFALRWLPNNPPTKACRFAWRPKNKNSLLRRTIGNNDHTIYRIGQTPRDNRLAASVAGVKALWGGFDGLTLTQALAEAYTHPGLSLVHVPVYYGEDSVGGMGAYGQWNVGNWCADVQQQYVKTLI